MNPYFAMDALINSPELGLGGLFLASFLAATLLPGGSELLFVGFLALHPEYLWPALMLTTLGNTLGGMSSYALGYFLPQKVLDKLKPRYLALARRWGPASLLFAWAPLIGDLLCLAAGWLRLNALTSALFMTAGKFARYAVLAGLLRIFIQP